MEFVRGLGARVNGEGGVKAGWIGPPPRGRTRALVDQHPKPHTLNPLIKMIQTKDFV